MGTWSSLLGRAYFLPLLVLGCTLGCKPVEKRSESSHDKPSPGKETPRASSSGGVPLPGRTSSETELTIPASELDTGEPPALPSVVARPRPMRLSPVLPAMSIGHRTIARPSSDRSSDEFRDARVGDFVRHRLADVGTLQRELLAVDVTEIRERQTRQASDNSPPVTVDICYQFTLPAESPPTGGPVEPAPRDVAAVSPVTEELTIAGRTLSCRVTERRLGERPIGRVWTCALVPLGGVVRLSDGDGRVLCELLDWGRK